MLGNGDSGRFPKQLRGRDSARAQCAKYPQNRSRELQATVLKLFSYKLPYTRSKCAPTWFREVPTPPEKLAAKTAVKLMAPCFGFVDGS
jgi:hypothetical protein